MEIAIKLGMSLKKESKALINFIQEVTMTITPLEEKRSLCRIGYAKALTRELELTNNLMAIPMPTDTRQVANSCAQPPLHVELI
jgi:hypothetical protein